MIESPLLDELKSEMKAQGIQDAIVYILEGRFGTSPPDVVRALRAILNEERLYQLARWAGQCPDLAAFQTRLLADV